MSTFKVTFDRWIHSTAEVIINAKDDIDAEDEAYRAEALLTESDWIGGSVELEIDSVEEIDDE